MSMEQPPATENPAYAYGRVTHPDELEDLTSLSATFEGHGFGYSPDDLEAYRETLAQPHSFLMLVRRDDGVPAGFIAASESLFPGSLFISELLVSQTEQGKGLGRRLLSKAVEFARSEGLEGAYTETESWNMPAQSLYGSFGFQEIENPSWGGGPTYRITF